MKSRSSAHDRRQTARMDTVIPVDIHVKSKQSNEPILIQGYTHDVSEGGLLLTCRTKDGVTKAVLDQMNDGIAITIRPLFMQKSIEAIANIAWQDSRVENGIHVFRFGISYQKVLSGDVFRLVRYARYRRRLPVWFAILIVIFGISIFAMSKSQDALKQQNKYLVNQMVVSAQTRQEFMMALDKISQYEREANKELSAYKQRLSEVTEKLKEASNSQQDAAAMQSELFEIIKEQKVLQNQLQKLKKEQQEKRIGLKADATNLEASRMEVIDALYGWIHRHRTRNTGMVPSHQGDPALKRTSFTYDQALVVLVESIKKDFGAAAKILKFFDNTAERRDGYFLNAYDTFNGSPIEWTAHVGPNTWLGIAALQYQRFSGDVTFLGMAESIGKVLMEEQLKHDDHGIPGGPGVEWFSTEHHLDAYAFFRMLWKTTEKLDYLEASERTFQWIQTYGTNVSEGRMNRGKGDATIATDTLSWAIAAIGPERLNSIAFDPEGIMEYAEENCRVQVNYDRPDGITVSIMGFDFAKPKHLSRGGIVSSEWTAQAIVTFQILGDYFEQQGEPTKALYYNQKAMVYRNELQKMIISSFSKTGQGKGCLPYATQPNADTGHGWRTPDGHKTGSVSGTAYGLFAWMDFNPFDLEDKPSS